MPRETSAARLGSLRPACGGPRARQTNVLKWAVAAVVGGVADGVAGGVAGGADVDVGLGVGVDVRVGAEGRLPPCFSRATAFRSGLLCGKLWSRLLTRGASLVGAKDDSNMLRSASGGRARGVRNVAERGSISEICEMRPLNFAGEPNA